MLVLNTSALQAEIWALVLGGWHAGFKGGWGLLHKTRCTKPPLKTGPRLALTGPAKGQKAKA